MQKSICNITCELNRSDAMNEKKSKYRINPPCPICGEEHCSWTIMLTEEEQAVIDDNGFVIVERELVCGACKKPFTAPVPVIYWDEVGYDKSLSLEAILKMQERLNSVNCSGD